MSDTNITRQRCKERGICMECYAPQSLGLPKEASAMYCDKCGRHQEYKNRKRSMCCGAPLRWKQRCPSCAKANADAISGLRAGHVASGRLPCGHPECAVEWNLLPPSWLPDEVNRARRGCVKDYLAKDAKTRALLQKHGWPDVLAHIDLSELFDPVQSKVDRAYEHIKEHPEHLAAFVHLLESREDLLRLLPDLMTGIVVVKGDGTEVPLTPPTREQLEGATDEQLAMLFRGVLRSLCPFVLALAERAGREVKAGEAKR